MLLMSIDLYISNRCIRIFDLFELNCAYRNNQLVGTYRCEYNYRYIIIDYNIATSFYNYALQVNTNFTLNITY